MSIAYNWTCSACGAANGAGTDACSKCGVGAVTSAAEIEQRKVKAEPRIDEPKTEPDSNAVAKMVIAALVILAGMAWFLTYDWPSGNKIGVGEFVLFWFREIIVLVVVVIVLLAMAFQSVRAKIKSDSNNK